MAGHVFNLINGGIINKFSDLLILRKKQDIVRSILKYTLSCFSASEICLLSYFRTFIFISFNVYPSNSSPSILRLSETHMGRLPAGMPAPVPNHGALTLLPSVSASSVCCRFANRTIQMVSSLLPPWPPTLATSEGQWDSLCDLCFSTVYHTTPPSCLVRVSYCSHLGIKFSLLSVF